jgi:hypothetical protein
VTLRLRHFTLCLGQGGAGNGAKQSRRTSSVDSATSSDSARSLLSSSSGRIGHVFLVATRRIPGFEQGMFDRLLRLAAAFPKVSIAVHAADSADFRMHVAALGLSAKVNIVVMPQGSRLWPWAQDRVLVVRDSAGALAVLDSGGNDDTGLAAADAIGAAGSIPVGFPLPGGNILVHDGVCFVGADLSAEVVARVETRRAVEVIGCAPLDRRGLTRFQIAPGDDSWRQDIDRSIAEAGSRQPIFHIDMFVTLAGTTADGRPRLLLGDPVWASDLIGVPLPDGFPSQAFAEIDDSLRARGFAVVRNPLPFVYFDNPDAKLREWFYASANNCWVEHDKEGGRVHLPEYGFGEWPELKATDDANAAIWEELGFEVVRGGDFLPLADQLGSLNCVSRILDRG